MNHFDDAFFSCPVIAVLRGLDPATTVAAATRAWDIGVRHVEIPIQTPAALPSLEAAARAAAERGVQVGAGTVTTPEQLDAAHRIGVSFTVSPGLDDDLVRLSERISLPHLPGVSTASEILRARKLGLTWLKAFPASELGAGWVKAMLGPFPDVRFVATGGMTPQNAPAMLAAGVRVVGLSAAFASDDGAEQVARLLRAEGFGF